MRTIPLGGKKGAGRVALVDDEDYAELSAFKWYYSEHTGGYACRNVVGPDGKRRIQLMHRMINNTPAGFDTDHINRDKLDNRRRNLRTATRQQNQQNRSGPQVNNTSGRLGVSFDRSRGRWAAYIRAGGKQIHLGRFATLDAAANARRHAEEVYRV